MGTKDRFEDIVRKDLEVRADDGTYDRMRDTVLGAHGLSQETQSATTPTVTRKTIMRSPMTKFGAAAAVIVAAAVVVSEFGGTHGLGNTVLADMIENMRLKPWVHYTVTSAVGGETLGEHWLGFDPPVRAYRLRGGKLSYRHEKEGIEYTFDPQKKVIYARQLADLEQEPEPAPDSPSSFLETMLRWLDEKTSHITRQSQVLDGRQVEVITAELTRDGVTCRIEVHRDIQENLLLRSKYENCENERKSMTMACDYPAEGPRSIHDVGAPAETEVVSLFMPPEISEIIRKLDARRKTQLTQYVTISVPTGITSLPTAFTGRRPEAYFTQKDDLVSSIWRNGDNRCHVRGYIPSELRGSATMDQVGRDPRQIAVSVVPAAADILQDGKQHRYHYQILDGARLRSRPEWHEVEAIGGDVFPEQIGWPRIVVPRSGPVQWRMETVTGTRGEELILIERRHLTVERWFLNPARDFLCQKHELARHSDGVICLSMEILEYAQTPKGQWYPRRLQKTEFHPEVGQDAAETMSRDIFLQEEPQFPPNIFDPESLPTTSK